MPVAVREQSFEEAERDWENILPSCSTNTIFVTPWWQRTWLRHFGNDSEVRVLSIHENGKSLGIAPLSFKEGVAGFLGSTDVCDYTDFLVPKGVEAAFYKTLLDYLAPMDWHTMNLRSLPEDSPTIAHLPAIAQRHGYEFAILRESVAPVAALPSSWEGYLAGLSKKHRHEVRRKLRRLAAAGAARQFVCEDPETIQGCMKEFFRLHRASSPDKAEFLTLEREAFFTEMALELAARGQFKLAFLELDGVRVASCISFDYLDSHLLYNSGYDPAYSRLSVGLLNKALAIKQAIEAGKREFDFLRGSERYKYDLGGKDREVCTLIVRR